MDVGKPGRLVWLKDSERGTLACLWVDNEGRTFEPRRIHLSGDNYIITDWHDKQIEVPKRGVKDEVK